jgi:hypothetical protein
MGSKQQRKTNARRHNIKKQKKKLGPTGELGPLYIATMQCIRFKVDVF